DRVVDLSPNSRYAKLNQILGKGAYKVVYKAIDREEGYEVAWNTCQATKSDFMELSDEIEILKRVRHPNIIQFFDCWYHNNDFVFVTELMTSGTLREYIRKFQIPNLKIVKRWARQILKGLSYLHSHTPPIIHRDIKCDNIFINGAHGEVKIGDMGTAKMRLGKAYTLTGTPEYIAPEMYEEKGYSEKVDIYAFGMALLEMVTGEYPYSECKNTAQIYRKVSSGIKPECLAHVSDPEVLDLINSCIGAEEHRLSAQEIVEHPFLAVDPEVVLLPAESSKSHLTMQVVFKGMDKLSVKFEFNVDTDTAEEVVNEMIVEAVLPAKYQRLVTGEINRILRDLRNEKEKSQSQAHTEAAYAAAVAVAQQHQQQQIQQIQQHQQQMHHMNLVGLSAQLPNTLPRGIGSGGGHSATPGPLEGLYRGAPDRPGSAGPSYAAADDVSIRLFADSAPVDAFVVEAASASNRGAEKALEWQQKLHAQDVMTVGDLRELHDEDWTSLGLTVFAARTLKNALYGRVARPS
ncbi:hypothetical protein CXG81DRAFT_5047, partial [Caulochytrium protostelioides]